MLRVFLVGCCVCFISACCLAQANTDVYKVTSPISSLTTELEQNINANIEPYKSGVIDPGQAVGILKALGADTNKPTIIHLLRWKDSAHATVSFQKWYFYDPTPPKGSFYLQSKEQAFQRTAIPGYSAFQLVYIHLNSDLTAGTSEWEKQGTVAQPTPTLVHPISYTITVAKAQTQFLQDVQTALQILGLKVAAATTSTGYFSVTTFQSQWTTSTITIAASLDPSDKTQGSAQNSAAGKLSSNTYTNEKPSWVGLSAGVQITSYKDITYQSSSGTLVPNSVTKSGVYFFLDGYFPPVLPSLSSFRYIPHPFFGLPIQGKVLRHSMLGVGLGLHWLEPFGGIIFDTQNNQVKGVNVNKTGITYQYVFGVKMSMSAVAKALKK